MPLVYCFLTVILIVPKGLEPNSTLPSAVSKVGSSFKILRFFKKI